MESANMIEPSMDNASEKQSAENGDDARTEQGQFAEGNPGGPGRPKGLPNKANALLKEDIVEAYRQRGGIDWLKGLKDREFVRLLEKTMPKEVAADLRMEGQPTPVHIHLAEQRVTFVLDDTQDQPAALPGPDASGPTPAADAAPP
jgi:hypothetical protein